MVESDDAAKCRRRIHAIQDAWRDFERVLFEQDFANPKAHRDAVEKARNAFASLLYRP